MSASLTVQIPLDIFTYPDIELPDVWDGVLPKCEDSLTSTVAATHAEARAADLLSAGGVRAGGVVAIGVGSRGICNLAAIVRGVVQAVAAAGCRAIIVPAMGSHGGGDPTAQAAILDGYGVNEAAVGAPVISQPDTVCIGTVPEDAGSPWAGTPLYWDRVAAEADGVLLVNRIKPHTDFCAPIESGIAKMAVIALGKRQSADNVHRFGARGLRDLLPRLARVAARRSNFLGGVAVIENRDGETAEVHALEPGGVGAAPESALLDRARSLAPRLPFDAIDVLVVDEIGKNISGAGMDTHVIGRGRLPTLDEAEWGGPGIGIIVALDIAADSCGNGTGAGLADIVARRLVDHMDMRVTLVNLRTSGEGGVLRASLPLVLDTPDDCVRAAIGASGRANGDVRLLRIRNTARVSRFEMTRALRDEAAATGGVELASQPHRLVMDRPLAV